MFSLISPRHLVCIAGCAALVSVGASCSSLRGGAVIQPEADQALRAMSTTVGGAPTMVFEATRSSDPELQQAAGFDQSAKVTVYVQRPDHVRVQSVSQEGGRDLYFNGKTVTTVDHGAKTFRVERAPATINQFVDDYTKGWAAYPPLADLVVSAPYSRIAKSKGRISLLKDETVNGVECRHVFCEGDAVDWDVWIGKGDYLPRRFDVAYGNLKGAPMTEGDLGNWQLAVAIDDAVFTPVIPAGYQPAGR
ncbi:DUF2092 domain-containing protein [Sulfuriroseicoccus oceanibius]|uniref:DUF2092 domain-containing protein n=1 Tax=Sulfuriroseicoccus oceanibius TaxID=2707525 RepID=A0A6B3LCH2_9BACT|nr:DUF2092 domain-containing protein [Sulfuriroseicoccus oceanibius]QQL45264.1 DUF2092 domain-containing protein [Sulfuriroseicoccus oceanibius]